MDELRVILLLIGAAILAVIYYFGRPRKGGQARNGQRRAARDYEDEDVGEGEDIEPRLRADHGGEPPTEAVSRELKRLGDLISRERKGDREPRQKKPESGARREAPARGDTKAEPPEESDQDRIVVLYIKARGDLRITGPRLIQAARMAGLEYGDMEIYHRLDESGNREPIFSMANMVAPGTLDQTQSPEFTTPGLALFMRLPGPLGALDAWDTMLATARRLAELLEADMLDENHSILNRQRIQQIREEMREYDRLATLEIRKPK